MSDTDSVKTSPLPDALQTQTAWRKHSYLRLAMNARQVPNFSSKDLLLTRSMRAVLMEPILLAWEGACSHYLKDTIASLTVSGSSSCANGLCGNVSRLHDLAAV